MATALVLEAAQSGLNASVVLPSGILGPGDLARGNMTRMLLAFCRGRLPLGVKGGYDFVDVRDVAAGVLACTERGKAGECYILSGHYVSIQDLLALTASLLGRKVPRLCAPAALASCAAPILRRSASSGASAPFSHLIPSPCFALTGIFKRKSSGRARLPLPPAQRNAPEHDSLVSGAESDSSCSLKGMCPVFALALPCLKNGNGQREFDHVARS